MIMKRLNFSSRMHTHAPGTFFSDAAGLRDRHGGACAGRSAAVISGGGRDRHSLHRHSLHGADRDGTDRHRLRHDCLRRYRLPVHRLHWIRRTGAVGVHSDGGRSAWLTKGSARCGADVLLLSEEEADEAEEADAQENPQERRDLAVPLRVPARTR